MKILYAANNNENSKIQLMRILNFFKTQPHQLKTAAYKRSSPSINIDWTLDALLNPLRPDLLSIDNDNVHIYYEQIKAFKPDLIISDLEYFTSYIAGVLNIPLWNCSSLLINYSLSHKSKYNSGITNQYSYLLRLDSDHHQKIMSTIHNADLNLVYSHFGDCQPQPTLKENFKWVRPYFKIGKPYVPCHHDVVACATENKYKIISLLKNRPDSVVFSETYHDNYDNIIIKSLYESEDYYCNIYNSNYFICEGQTNFLADAFYNGKKSFIVTNYKDMESITNSMYSKHLGTGQIISNIRDVQDAEIIEPTLNQDIYYLHQLIEEL